MARASRRTQRSFKGASKAFRNLAGGMSAAAAANTRVIAEEILTDVKAARQGKGVPVDTGTLRSTGRATGPTTSGESEISFGGPAAPYALVQHERTDYSHTVGEARYLVRGLERWEAGGSAAFRALQQSSREAITLARVKGAL